jgi:enterochelin esterase-like enzyme
VARLRLRLPLGLSLALAAGAILQQSPLGKAIESGLASLDFDPARTALLSAWIACFAVALMSGVLTARPWPSTSAAIAFLAVTYVAPWAWHSVYQRPVLFGSPENLDGAALVRNVAVTLAVGLLVAVFAAAAGRLLSEGLGSVIGRGAMPLAALAACLVVTALGVGPLLRYGPSDGVFKPTAKARAVLPGEVQMRTFQSQAMGDQRPFAIYLPRSYKRSADRLFPTVYLLHGDPGSYRDWLRLGVASLMDSGTAAGALAETIVVIPDGNGRPGRATRWADSRDGKDRVESALLELVSAVDAEYRTLHDPRRRVVAGLSDGGFGAANVAARHPDVFGVAISLSGYFSAEGAAFGPDPAFARANSPSSLVVDQPSARSVLFVLVAGREDPRYLSIARGFAAELKGLGVRHSLFELPGGHDGGVWTSGLVVGLREVKPQLEQATS